MKPEDIFDPGKGSASEGHLPANLITSELAWEDLVLSPEVVDEVQSIITWLQHSQKITDDEGVGPSLKPGYRCLFHGPPGTGKTLTATLLGSRVGVDVYRIDLSRVTSKYIGETEKNLARVFDRAERKNWILFFDEADALFGKRTDVPSSHDRYANQEVSYLLQRIEDYSGLVILATNLKSNIDPAFVRRFQSVIHFPLPDAEQRLRLWTGVADRGCPLAKDIDLSELAHEYDLSGGGILSVARYGAIKARADDRESIRRDDLLEGLRNELRSSGGTA